MDHVPAVKALCRSALQIPYLSGNVPPCQYGCFTNYPYQNGQSVRRLEVGDSHGCSLEELAPLLQEWLFFGIMNEIFQSVGITFRKEDFVSGDSRFISTRHLTRYIWYWVTAETCMPRPTTVEDPSPSPQDLRMSKVHDHLFSMNKVLNALICQQSNSTTLLQSRQSRHETREADLIVLSLAILGETLDWARSRVYWSGFGDAKLKNLHWELPEVGRRLLSDAGWCKAEIRAAREQCPYVSCLYYLSTFERSALGKDHSACGERCVANQINDATYITQHIRPGCSCANYGAESGTELYEYLCSILDRGGTPIIRVLSTENGPVVSFDETGIDKRITPYVTISHVWSDGMGNPRANTLPSCQLQWLQKIVDALHMSPTDQTQDSHVPFWIDTLCVPLEEQPRKLAIRRMSKTYRESEKVLVLDASLRQVSADCAPEEALMRIKFSSWATRLWTYQEGVLAKQLFFQFKERAVNSETLEDAYMDANAGFRTIARYIPEDISIADDPLVVRLLRAMVLKLSTARKRLNEPTDAEKELFAADPDLKIELEQILATHPPQLQTRWERIVSQSCPDFPDDLDERLLDTIEHPLSEIIHIQGWKALHQYVGEVFRHSIAGRNWRPETAFFTFARAISGRMTSKADDETLCISGILSLDVVPLLKYKGMERMKRFLSLLGSYRSDIVFAKTERIDEPGFRWAPKSFLDGAIGAIGSAQLTVALAPYVPLKGLLVEWPGLLVNPLKFPLPSTNTLLAIRERAPNDQGDGFTVDKRAIDAYAAHESQGFGLFTLRLLGKYETWNKYSSSSGYNKKLRLVRNHLNRASAILVTVEDEKTESTKALYVKFEAHVSIIYENGVDGRDVNIDALVQHIHYKQQWCVG